MGRYSKKKKKIDLLIRMIAFIICILSALFIHFNSNLDTQIVQANSTILDAKGELYIYYFDVGQADSSLLINDGKTMLIDAGNNEDGEMIVNKIKELGITKLDYVVGTHAHEDHIGGMDDVIENFEIGNIYLPEAISTSKTYEEVLDAIANKNLDIIVPEIGDEIIVGTVVGTVKSIGNNDNDLNNSSIVLRAVYGEKSFLFMGDLEESIEKKYSWERTDVLKVGHHGSNTSSCEEFLNQVLPEISIISVGEGNSYNHPGEYTLQRLNKIKTQIYRTDERGTIKLISDGSIITIETEK